MDIREEIAKRVKEEREQKGLTHGELAERAGCSARILEYWESGKRYATDIRVIDRVLKALGIEWRIGSCADLSSANSDFQSAEEKSDDTEERRERMKNLMRSFQ